MVYCIFTDFFGINFTVHLPYMDPGVFQRKTHESSMGLDPYKTNPGKLGSNPDETLGKKHEWPRKLV